MLRGNLASLFHAYNYPLVASAGITVVFCHKNRPKVAAERLSRLASHAQPTRLWNSILFVGYHCHLSISGELLHVRKSNLLFHFVNTSASVL